MKYAFAAALVAATAMGCATAQDAKPAAPAAEKKAAAGAKAGCTPPPKELVVKELETGQGERMVLPRAGIWVTYTGWLYDGCAKDLKGVMFDTSAGRNTPFSFMAGAGRVIRGWDEGVMGMREGTKRLLIIPPDKGYGEKGAGEKIPPNATLVFEVQVVGIPFPAPGSPGAPPPGAPAPGVVPSTAPSASPKG